MTGYGLEGWSSILSVTTDFLYSTVSYARVTGIISSGVERPGREANLSTPSSAEVKIEGTYNCTPDKVFMAWCLIN
jgi:hypothetical protein